MKKSIVAIPVVMALISFGITAKSMADPITGNDLVVPIADAEGLSEADATAINDSALGNNVAENGSAAADGLATAIALKDNEILTSKDAEAEGIGNAAATSGGIATSSVRYAVLESELTGAVAGNVLIFGNDLENDASGGGNIANGTNTSTQTNAASATNTGGEQENDADATATGGAQTNAQAASNTADQDAVAVSISDADAETESNGDSAAANANANTGANVSEQEAKAKGEWYAGDAKAKASNGKTKAENAALQANGQEAENKELVANKQDQENNEIVASNQEQSNEAFQANVVDAGEYKVTQEQTVYLQTGNNNISNLTAPGINALVQNTGIQSQNQVSVNVQANVY